MKFPKKLAHQRQVLAKIYGKKPSYPFYRLAYRVNGKRKMESYPTYSAARKRGDALVKELYKGSQVSALNAAQARDALAAFERLEAYRTATGRRVSLLAAVSQFAESSTKLGVRTLGEAVDTFLTHTTVCFSWQPQFRPG